MPKPHPVAALLVGAVLGAAPLADPPAGAAAVTPAATLAATVTGTATAAAPPDPGHDRIGVRRGGAWLLRDSLDGGAARVREDGLAGWLPVAGDLDGDGADSLGLFLGGVWRLRDGEAGPVRTVRFGLPGDRPVVGDWDGDGTDTLGVVRGGRWFLRASNGTGPAAYRTFGFGVRGDVPVVGDWDADGDTDVAVRRGTRWYQRDSASGGLSTRTFLFGRAGDVPVAGDWDHDGRDTPGLFRAGTWFFRAGSGFGGLQSTTFGRPGDRPVVRRTPGLAPGAAHRVVRTAAPAVAHVATVDLAAASTPDAVLSGGDLRGVERTSSMARRSGAPLAVNADYFLGDGRPVHAMAADGRLLQTPQLLGRAFSLDASGTQVRTGFPDVRVELATAASATVATRWNSDGPSGDQLAGFTGPGAGVATPPAEACYVGARTSAPVVVPDGGVESRLDVTGTRCGGPPPDVGPTTTVLAGLPGTAAEHLVRSLAAGQSLRMTARLGFPGAVDVLGGNPQLVRDGVLQTNDLDLAGAFFERQPRTAVGVTADGRLLLVVVDGRQPGYSVGMTLRELAELLVGLGARDALNLDGGGSSTMALNGLVANRPSDGRERPVANALVLLPGADPGQGTLRTASGLSGRSALRGAGASLPPGTSSPAGAAWRAAAQDPGSVGGLADALAARGRPLPPGLRRADVVFDAAR